MIELMKAKLTFSQSEIQDGDVICFQVDLPEKEWVFHPYQSISLIPEGLVTLRVKDCMQIQSNFTTSCKIGWWSFSSQDMRTKMNFILYLARSKIMILCVGRQWFFHQIDAEQFSDVSKGWRTLTLWSYQAALYNNKSQYWRTKINSQEVIEPEHSWNYDAQLY